MSRTREVRGIGDRKEIKDLPTFDAIDRKSLGDFLTDEENRLMDRIATALDYSNDADAIEEALEPLIIILLNKDEVKKIPY